MLLCDQNQIIHIFMLKEFIDEVFWCYLVLLKNAKPGEWLENVTFS